MLIFQFLLVNAHFVSALLAALIFFSIFWLYFDAWLNVRNIKGTIPFIGFFLLSASFVTQSLIIDQALLRNSLFGSQIVENVTGFLRSVAYLVLIIAQMKDKLQPLPDYRKKPVSVFIPAGVGAFSFLAGFLHPVLAAVTGFMYLRRATKGLEDHLKPIALGFFVLAVSELIGLSSFFRTSNNVLVSGLTAAFGVWWVLQRVVLLCSIYIFGKWAWRYLLKRFDTQLFIIFTTSILVIFLTTAITFTFATLNNVKNDLLSTLKTDVGVLGYTIESKKNEVLADAETLAQNVDLVNATVKGDRKILADITVPVLVTKKASELLIISQTGEILLRADDTEARGGSLSENQLVKKALLGEKAVSMVTREGAVAPFVSVRAVAPIFSEGKAVGAVLMGSDIDNAYVDGLKKATGLESSVYADNIRSATTLVSLDGKSRYIGIKEGDSAISKHVLNDAKMYVGSTKLLSVPYFSAYAPLLNSDNNPVGMLFVGKPEVSILQTAGRSIELTFVTTVILLLLSVVPSYLVSKYIEGQIR